MKNNQPVRAPEPRNLYNPEAEIAALRASAENCRIALESILEAISDAAQQASTSVAPDLANLRFVHLLAGELKDQGHLAEATALEDLRDKGAVS